MSTWRSATAALTATLLGVGLVTAGAVPAQADATGYWGLEGVYGPNQSVLASGSLTRDCDFIYTASDVYVVPSGTVSTGSGLSDVSGTPNTIQSAMLGSAFIDEVLAITQPSGTLGPGTYDVVEDTCQNGVFDGSDTILREAFSVRFPSDVPPLPDPAIAAMKAGATDQAEHWRTAAYAYAALLSAHIGYSMASGFTGPGLGGKLVNFYLTYVCLAIPTPYPADWYCPTVGVNLMTELYVGVVLTILNQSDHYAGIAADPPDPDFVGPALVGPVDTFPAPLGDPLDAATAAWADTTGEGAALSAAFLGALEKYQGAQEAGDAAAALMHARAIEGYARDLQHVMAAQDAAADELLRVEAELGADLDATLATLAAEQAAIAADGIASDDARELRNAGLDAAGVAALEDAIVGLDLDNPAGSLDALVAGQKAANASMTAAFDEVATGVGALVPALEAAVARSGGAPYPVVDAGGTHTATAGTAVTLTATCATCTEVAWDLDADGEHDDATGTSVVGTFDRAGSAVVSVRGTDAAGRRSVDLAHVDVAALDGPALVAVDPPTDDLVRAPVGTTRSFRVDAPGSTVDWDVDGTPVGTGTTYDHVPAAAPDATIANVRAVVTTAEGATRALRWRVLAVHPDADGDGWTANVDCDDADASARPDGVEVPGNGRDDDCDPATPDVGPPVARFVVEPEPAIVGEAAVLRDTTVASAGGAPVAWSWDVDGDGSADYTTERPEHTFAARGTVPVTLEVVDGAGLGDTVTRDVVVTDRPVARFEVSPVEPAPGQPVQLVDGSTDADGVVRHEWDLDHDGTTFDVDSTDASPTVTFDRTRTVALRVTDALGVVSHVVTGEVRVVGPPAASFVPRPAGGGTDVALTAHGGVLAEVSSEWSSTYAGVEMIDVDYPSTDRPWRTANGAVTNQHATVRLDRTYLVDRVEVRSSYSRATRPVNVRVGAAAAGSDAFTTVAEAVLADDSGLQVVELDAPVAADRVRYEALDNRGGSSIATDELRVVTGQVGDATVTFEDRSTDPDGTVVAWEWDFGDGSTSAEREPTHTYAAPGTYVVTLTVTDDAGERGTTTLEQTVVGPLQAEVTAPARTVEGTSVRIEDTTVPQDAAIVERAWDFGDGSRTTGTVAPSHVFPDDGTYEVTMSVRDTRGRSSSATTTVTVSNAAPTVSAGADTTVRLLDGWAPAASVADPGSTDARSLECVWDRGDGTVERLSPCTTSTVRARYDYATAGMYTATLTVTDKDGATASDSTVVTVERRPAYVSAHVVPGTESRGHVTARAVLWDRATWEPLAGRVVTLGTAGREVEAETDEHGVAEARVPLEDDRDLVSRYAGDAVHAAAQDADSVPRVPQPPGDVLFLVDESGSMGGYQAAVRAHVLLIASELARGIDYQIGLVGFGADGQDYLPHTHLPATDELTDVEAALAGLRTSGGTEPGIDAVVHALEPGTGLRPEAATCLVLVGDESTQRASATVEDARAALEEHEAVLFAIVSPGASTQDYQDLATGSGGAVFDIAAFGRDPQPVLESLSRSCVTAVTERPDLVTTVDDGRDRVAAGEHVTYTVTVENQGAADATGVEITAALPEGLELVGASDAGEHDAPGSVGGILTWRDPTVAAGATARVTFVARVVGPQEVDAPVTVRAEAWDDGASGADLTPANNAAEDVDTVARPSTLTVVTAVETADGEPARLVGPSALATRSAVPTAGGLALAVPPPVLEADVLDVPLGTAVVVRDRDGRTVAAAPPLALPGSRHVLVPGAYAVAVEPAVDGYTVRFADACAADGAVDVPLEADVTCTVTLVEAPAPAPAPGPGPAPAPDDPVAGAPGGPPVSAPAPGLAAPPSQGPTGGLATTGASVAVVLVLAAFAVLAGSVLVLRRRTTGD